MKAFLEKVRKHLKQRYPVYAVTAAVLAVSLVLTLVVIPGFRSSDPVSPVGGSTVIENPIKQDDDSAPPPTGTGLFDIAQNGILQYAANTGADFVRSLFGSLSVAAGSKTAGEGLYDIPLDSPITLSTEKSTDAETLREVLSVSPAMELTVTAASDREFLIQPASGTWREDTLYRLSVGNPSMPAVQCAFQTAHSFTVKKMYPADSSVSVPVDTGIEITFTDPVRNADFEKYITTTPAFPGRFSLYPDGKTVVIIPDKPLEEGTEYVVRVAEGLTADNGIALEAGRVSRFRTVSNEEAAEDIILNFSLNREIVVSPGCPISESYSAGLYSNSGHGSSMTLASSQLYAAIYSFGNADAALAAIMELQKDTEKAFSVKDGRYYSSEGMSPVFEGSIECWKRDDYSSSYESGVLYLPDLPLGTYLAEITFSCGDDSRTLEAVQQVILQVTDLRAYTESCDGSALIWVNRADTGKAAASAEIEAEIFSSDSHWSCTSDGEPLSFCKDTLKTDENGLCTLETGDDNQAFLLIKHKNDTLIVGAQVAAAAPFDTLYTYLYTDRSVYFSDDTIRFWGILGKSYAGQQIPDTLELTIGSQTRSTTIHVSENGTFEGSFPIEAWTAYGISFSLSDPERGIILSRFVRVTQEDKPIYTMSVAFDKLFYTYGEDATVTVTTSFFDGTPASGLEVMLYPNPYGEQKTLKTGQDGTASYTFRTGNPFQYETATHPSMISVSAELIGMETACLTDYKSALYFHASGCMRIDQISGDCTELYLNHLDTSALKTPADLSYPAFPENTYGVPMNTEVSVTLSKIEHIRIPQKPLYDAIQKKTVTYDRWSDETTLIFQKNMAVTDGKLILEHYDASDFNGYYLYEIIWHDPVNGHDYKQSVYAVRRSWSGGFESIQCEDIYEVLSDRAVAAVGDTVTAQVFYGGQPAGDIPILSVHYKGSKGRCEVIPAGSLSFVFDEDCILGTQVDATVFVNGEYQVLNPLGIEYDYNKQNILDVTIVPDKDSYKPGETAEFTVRAPGAAGGSVLVSIVDEACFALGDQNADPLNSYFSSISARYYGYTKYVNRGRTFSLFPENQRWYYFNDVYGADFGEVEESVMEAPMKDAAAPAAGNGGSDVYIRKAFADNPYFASVPLDENGCAVVSMQIPDNITTWRVTACATHNTTSDLLSEAKLGSAVSDTVCTLPFFLNVSACDLYLTDDDVSVGARAAGTVIGEIQNSEMTYSAVLSDESGKTLSEQTITASANGYGWFHFGQLPIGEYSVTIKGECIDDAGNRYTDGMQANFSVSGTAFIMPVRRTITPAELSSLHISGYPLTLTFHDDSYDLLLTVMNRLWCMGSARYDMAAANYAAVMTYQSFFSDNGAWWYPKESAERNRTTLNSFYGFIPELEWAEGDPEITARILACVPDVLTAERKSALAGFYRDLITAGCSDEVQLCAAYLGLAACGEPVLSDLYVLAQGAGFYPLEAKLYITAAFAVIGDQSASKAAWKAIAEDVGTAEEDQYFLVGTSTEESIRFTALGLMAAVHTDRSAADGMVRYLLTHTSAVDTHALELAAYVTQYTPSEVKETTFAYSIGDKAETVTLHAGEHFTLSLTKSDFEALSIKDHDPSLRITASYGGTAEEALSDAKPSEILKISKTIEPFDEKNGIYRVTISYQGKTDRDHVCFTLSDCIPSGARYVSDYYSYSDHGYIWHKGGQMMSGNIYASRPWSGKDFILSEAQPYSFDGELSYLIRGAVSGTFFFEGANAISRETGTYAQTEYFVIEISEDGWKIN